jgi:hypothetical protein
MIESSKTATAQSTQDASTTCSVTNSSTAPGSNGNAAQVNWDGSVVAINAYNTSDTDTTQGYAQTLALLPFSGGNTLASGATDTITLDQTIVVNGKTVPVTLYDLIFAQSNNLFPVLDVSEAQTFTAPYTYPAITIPGPASAAAANTLLFLQDIWSFPSSTLAKDFSQTINNTTQNAGSSSGMTQALNAFFANTESFTNVTFASYIAVSTYINTFAFAWANFAASYTYYVYQSSGGSTGSGATLLGEVTFTSNGSSGLPSLTDTSGGYTISFTPTGGTSVPLFFSQQQLVSDLSSSQPSICLQLSYMQLSQFTGNATDATNLVPVAFGNLNGNQVIALNAQNSTDSGFLTSVENFFNSKGMQLVLQVLGLMMGIKMLAEGAQWLYKKFRGDEQANDGNPVEPQQAAADRQQAQGVEDNIQQQQQDVADRLGAENPVDVPDSDSDVETDESDTESDEEYTDTEEEVDSEEEEITEQSDELEEEAEVSVDPEMESIANDDRSEMSDLQSLDPTSSNAQSDLAADQKAISSDETEVKSIEEEDEGSFSEEEKEEAEEEQELEEDEEEEEDEENDADDEASDGDDLEDLDEDV